MHEHSRLSDRLTLAVTRHQRLASTLGLRGALTLTLVGPDGLVKAEETVPNLITQVGDQMYAENGAGVTGAPAAPTGMRLGTGTTTASKTGAGAAIGTYISGSALALDAEPGSALNGSARRITYICTWDGSETFTGIREVVVTNATIADAAGVEANTIARVVVASKTKDSGDTLVATWTHDVEGS